MQNDNNKIFKKVNLFLVKLVKFTRLRWQCFVYSNNKKVIIAYRLASAIYF